MAFQTSTALSTASVIVGVRIPTPFRRLLGRTGVGTWDLDWYREWQVGYRGRDPGEDREKGEETLSSTGKNRRGWERHDLAGEFCVRDTIRVHVLRICHATKHEPEQKGQK
jgi:hypothetical protein